MNLIENIKIALEGLRLNKLRTFLTMLGIIIGISSVIAIVTIGDAMTNSVSQGFDSFGNNLIAIVVRPTEGFEWAGLNSRDNFPLSSVEEVKERFGNRIDEIVIHGASSAGTAVRSRDSSSVNISSTSPGEVTSKGIEMVRGRFLEDEDINSQKEVIVISDVVVEDIFNNDYDRVLGNEIQINTSSGNNYYTIVGVYKHEPISFGGIPSDIMGSTTPAYIPYTLGNSQYGSVDTADTLNSFDVLASSRTDVESLGQDISDFYNEYYYYSNNNAEVSYRSLESQLAQINEIMGTISLAIGGIAAISLLVGGIGVMNILLVSVTERTREIGIRKALGATNTDIQGQFIIESIIICLIGGFIGIVLGGVFGYAASFLLDTPTQPSIPSIIIAFVFSMIIGVFFGYYPASKAAKLNPIDALRYE